MHPPFYLMFKTVLLGWGKDEVGENTTFIAYKTTKEVHLAGSGEHSNAKLSCTETTSLLFHLT